MNYIKIPIKLHKTSVGMVCSKRCMFYREGITSDFCDYFGRLQRVREGKYISFQHPVCKDNTIS